MEIKNYLDAEGSPDESARPAKLEQHLEEEAEEEIEPESHEHDNDSARDHHTDADLTSDMNPVALQQSFHNSILFDSIFSNENGKTFNTFFHTFRQ